MELLCGVHPQWARPPLVAFPVQAHSSGRSEIDILEPEVGHLLDSGASVIEEEQKRAIPERLGPVPRQRGEEHGDFIALEKARLGWRHAFHRDRRYALGHVQHLREAPGEVVEEGVEACDALIPCPDVIMALVLQVAQEAKHALEAEISSHEPADLAPRVLRGEAEK